MPKFVEICCGHAQLSRVFADRGWKVIAVDYEDNKLEPLVEVTSRDLRDRKDLQSVLRLLDDADYVHLAPPCGTFSRAREIPVSGGPLPLRDTLRPAGLPGLTQAERARVDAANRVAKACLKIIQRCLNKGIYFTVENPANSLIWKYAGFSVLYKIYQHVVFDACMHGSKRRKATRMLTNCVQMAALNRECDGRHEHLPWGREQGNWATASESAYPYLLCRRMFDIMNDVVRW
jgi:hypothetical protein